MTNYDYLYNKEYFGDSLNINHFSKKKLHFQIIENGTILPFKGMQATDGFGGLIDADGNFLPRSSIHMGVGGAYTPSEPVQYVPTTAIYLGMFLDIWGHCLTDNIKRLWFFQSETYLHYFRHCPVLYTSMWGGVLPNFIKLLKILDIDINRLILVNKPTKFKNVVFPDESFFLDDTGEKYQNAFFTANSFFTEEYVQTVDRIRNFALKNYSPLDNKKYYFYHGRNQIGEERLAEYFKSKGYEIVQPEKISLEEQLNIFVNCESFASTMGSCTHNSIFLRDNSEVIIIPRWVKTKLNAYQQALNQLHNLQVDYIDSAFSIFAPDNGGPFCYVLSKQLKKFFGDEDTDYTDADFETFLMYFKLCMNNGAKPNPYAVKYYGDTYAEFFAQLQKRQDLMQKYGVQFK